MPIFPRTKHEILILAAQVVEGIENNPGDFPNPPFDAALLKQRIGENLSIIERRQQKEAEAMALTVEDDEKNEEVSELTRQFLNQAEALYADNAPKLKELGWNVRAERTYKAPGTARDLEGERVGPGIVRLDWRAPERSKQTGETSGYRIERQVLDLETRNVTEEWGVWQFSTYETEQVLHGQPQRMEVNYRVIANNRTGDGPASDLATVVP